MLSVSRIHEKLWFCEEFLQRSGKYQFNRKGLIQKKPAPCCKGLALSLLLMVLPFQ